MNIVPAITLSEGRCVNMSPVDSSESIEVSDDPIDLAGRWMDKGAPCLFVYDLDGAQEGKAIHQEMIKQIAMRFPNFPLVVYGGANDMATIEAYLKAGVAKLVLGDIALANSDLVKKLSKLYEDRILLGLNVLEGSLVEESGVAHEGHSVSSLLAEYQGSQVCAVLVNDLSGIARAQGVDIDTVSQILQATSIPVWTAGGVADMDDIRALYAEADEGIESAVIGRALAQGSLDMREASQYCEE